MFQRAPLTSGSSARHTCDMADDPNAKPPPPPEIIVEGDWPPFLRQPTDLGERARRAQQAADERAQQAVDEQRELERLQREREHTAHGRGEKSKRHQLKVDIYIKVAETKVSPGTPADKAWEAAGNSLKQVNTHLQLEYRLREPDGSPCRRTTQRKIYDAIRVPRIWSRITSLRSR
jgi:hypothetical protein